MTEDIPAKGIEIPADTGKYSLNLPYRCIKPRASGITAINDVGIPLHELTSILDDFHPFVDIAKIGIGSALVATRLREKLEAYRLYDILVYFGGTLFEKFFHKGKIDQYLAFLREFGIDTIEVSCGTIESPIEERLAFIETVVDDFRIIGEVGSKNPDKLMPPSVWINEIGLLLDAGCSHVILEGRDSANAGMYRPSGEMRSGLLADILETFDSDRLIFEAPNAKTQIEFIQKLGSNVNLGNVMPRELLQLEAQRRGLRSDTFFI